MSKICENCGNMIPDGTDICPSCGWEDDSSIKAIQDLLNAETKPETRVPRKAPAKKPSQGQKKPGTGTKKPSNASKKRKKKESNKGLIGACVALAIILIAVIGAAIFMLSKLGFFTSVSDDELLGTPTQMAAPSPSELPTAEPTPEPPEEPSVEEEILENSTQEEPEPSEEPVECTKFKVTGTEYPFLYSRGETTEVVYIIEPEDARKHIEWESSDETIATVSDYGVISARRGGSCTITGTCGDKSITVYVTCDFTVPDTILDMNYEDVTMSYEGQTLELKIDYELTEEQIAATVWESSDEAVATVDDQGVVTAVADGTAIITASILDYTASCIVRCVRVTGNQGVNNPNSEYAINYSDVTLDRKGEYFQLSLKSVLGNEVPEFTWSSDDTKVATVDSKGIVTAVADGTCKITTTVGGDSFQCIVRVKIKG